MWWLPQQLKKAEILGPVLLMVFLACFREDADSQSHRSAGEPCSGENCDTGSGEDQLAPDAPTMNLAAFVSQSRIDISWTDVANEEGYIIEQSLDGSDWQEVVTTEAADVVEYSFNGLISSTSYQFRVLAYNTTGSSDPSNVVSVTTLARNAVIDSSSSQLATSRSPQRKTFFDVKSNRHWAFYYDGTAINYAFSKDATKWTALGTINLNTPNFAITQQTISGNTFVLLVAEANNYDVVLYRASLTNSSMSFESAITVFDGSSSTDYYSFPTIGLDEDNYVWLASAHNDGSNALMSYQVAAIKSTNGLDGDLSAWQAVNNLGRRTAPIKDIAIMPRGGSQMYLLTKDTGNIVGFLFDGTSWSTSNTGGDYSWFTFPGEMGTVSTLTVSGSLVYVGGAFTDAGGNPAADKIAYWDGSNWNALGTGLNGSVYSIVVSGSDVYVGGTFSDAGGVAEADWVAHWDGTSWKALGSGLDNTVNAVAVLNDDVYVGGWFSDIGGITDTDFIARWDGTSWNALGSGLDGVVQDIKVSGSDVYVGGDFTDSLKLWDGTSWSVVGGGLNNTVMTIEISGSDIYVGGAFTSAGSVGGADRIAYWDGAAWNALGTGLTSIVNAIGISGTNIYAGGSFVAAGGDLNADKIAYWDGVGWNPLASGLGNTVNAVGVLGTDIYIGGSFVDADGNANADKLAKWSGAAWSNVGISSADGLDGKVHTIAVSGSDLYLGGEFNNAFGVAAADYLVHWDGSAWSDLGAGPGGIVYSIRVSGTDVYVGGDFSDAGGNTSADRIGRWDGAAWQDVGGGIDNGVVYAIAVSGSDIYLGGSFDNAGANVDCDKIAHWDGGSWNGLNVGGLSDVVYALEFFGTDLYAGGDFTTAGGVANADRFAYWDGVWNVVGSGLNNTVKAIAVLGTDIYVGGSFTNGGGHSAADGIAYWNGTSWKPLGTSGASFVEAIAVLGSDVYIGGTFNNAAGIAEADKVARWDGSNWYALGGGVDGTVYALGSSSDTVYVGGDFITAEGSTSNTQRFVKWAPSVGESGNDFSALSDSAGNIHLTYTDLNSGLYYKSFDGTTWSSNSLLATASAQSPAMSINLSTSNLFAFWLSANSILHKKFSYGTSNWDSSATTLFNTGVNRYLISDRYTVNDQMLLIWTNGTSNPFNVQSYLHE